MTNDVLETTVTLDPSGKSPWVSIEFGHLRLGAYRIYLTNPGETETKQIGHGSNEDALPDRFPIGLSPTALKGYYLTIDGIISAIPPESDPEGPFTVIVNVTQDGSDVDNSPVIYPQPSPGTLTKNGVGAMLMYIELA